MKKGTVLYVMDPLCGWCYGFSNVMQEMEEKYAADFDFRVIVGGMITGERVAPVSHMSNYILGAYKRVEDFSGAKFGEPYLDFLRDGSDINNSEPPCRAIYSFGQIQPEKMLDFAHELQLKHFVEGKSFNDENTYRELAIAFGLNADEFIESMNTEDAKYGTQQDFQWVKAAGIEGFPCTVLHYADQYYLLAQGFQKLESVEKVIESVMAGN